MNLTEELRKLADLHQQGHLTDTEFTDAKASLIAEDRAARPADGRETSGPDAPIADKTFQSSRWSAGNLFFPDRLTLGGDGLHFRKRSMFGSSEEHISYHSVASLRVQNGVFLSTLTVETSGGTQPIFVNGLWKSDAREIQETIRAHQGGGLM